MPSQDFLIEENILFLSQAKDLLERISDHVYTDVVSISPRGAIGGHLRHCLDFYGSFLRGLERGLIDYDERRRDAVLETDRRCAAERIDSHVRGLRDINSPFDTVLQVRCCEGGDGVMPSSLRRELTYLAQHTVHHFALISMLLRHRGIEPPREFGVAPSTLKHWKEQERIAG